ncbi:MAG: beta-ketoacyl synthase chain length factor [Methylomonas sp.]|nr:beta-ketoacyl synthase chain length factor [Methylomonas sp.]
MESISVLGFAASASDDGLRDNLSFRCVTAHRETIPVALRRRSSQAMHLVFSAASEACVQARRSPEALPVVFASVAGEIQTTDQLCRELAKADGLISPSAFHNSVQNAAAGYWSIARQCTQPASALAAGQDTFAMALLEAWCQLAGLGGELLLVCYDECWPGYLMPGSGRSALACALMLAAGPVEGSIARLGRPQRGTIPAFPAEWRQAVDAMPVLAAIPLLEWLANGGAGTVLPISASSAGWWLEAGI